MKEKTESRNQTFNYLYAMAIIMVIDDHVSRRINLFNNIFPYNSFYMPLFVFCSGYFFKQSNVFDACMHKVKKLMIPYIIWNFIFNFIAMLIDFFVGTKWFVKPDLKNIISMVFPGKTLSSINDPAWFLNMLFWVSIIYIIIRNIVTSNIKNDILLLGIFLICGIISVEIASKGFTDRGGGEKVQFICL